MVKKAPPKPEPKFRINKCYWQGISTTGYKPSAQQIQEILVGCNEYGIKVISIVKTTLWTDPVIFFFTWYMQFEQYKQVENMFEMTHKKLSIQDNNYYKCFVETAKSMNIQISDTLQKSNCKMVLKIPESSVPDTMYESHK